jgi:hypothetical protein
MSGTEAVAVGLPLEPPASKTGSSPLLRGSGRSRGPSPASRAGGSPCAPSRYAAARALCPPRPGQTERQRRRPRRAAAVRRVDGRQRCRRAPVRGSATAALVAPARPTSVANVRWPAPVDSEPRGTSPRVTGDGQEDQERPVDPCAAAPGGRREDDEHDSREPHRQTGGRRACSSAPAQHGRDRSRHQRLPAGDHPRGRGALMTLRSDRGRAAARATGRRAAPRARDRTRTAIRGARRASRTRPRVRARPVRR